MGLKRDSYKSEKLNIEIAPAYAMVGRIEMENDTASVEIRIHRTREDLETYEALESCNMIIDNIDRNKSIYEQIYTKAKEELFIDWEDSIEE